VEFPHARNFAYCSDDLVIVVAPKMVKSADHRIEGVLAHELGHAINFYLGNLRHSERDADDMAERIFGTTIFYDRDTVQSTEHGVSPRPSFLPQ
jgi:predicted SprT family Zn-dependent metalloprotease